MPGRSLPDLFGGGEEGSLLAVDDVSFRVGAGQVSLVQYAVPKGALPFWTARLPARGATLVAEETAFGEARARFEDPDGMHFALVETDDRTGRATEDEKALFEFETDVTEYSRLSCQIEVSEALDGLVVSVPQR